MPDQQARLNKIVAEPSNEHVAELADMVANVLSDISDDEVGLDSEPVDPADLIAMWNEIGGQGVTTGRPGRFIDKHVGAEYAPADPQAAGLNPVAAIRNGIRITTVQLMKDRAGTVGGSGVAQIDRRHPRRYLDGHQQNPSAQGSARHVRRQVLPLWRRTEPADGQAEFTCWQCHTIQHVARGVLS